MNTLQINYDLVVPRRNYPAVYGYIESTFPTRVRPLKSMWLVRTHKAEDVVLNELAAVVDADDEILVMDVTNDSWATNFEDDSTEWMHAYSTVRVAAA
jgi:hypothetical protein